MIKSVCSCMRSQFPSARWALARRFSGGGGGGNKLVGEACTLHNAVKSGFFELYFLLCLLWTHNWKSAYSFLSLGSYMYLNMYHGYASLKKEHFLSIF